MKSQPTVAVLMSTYNGEKYLHEQIDSIFAQIDVNVKLIVRDDGSTDNTLEILKEYKDVHIINEDNIGCEESFKRLLYFSIHADYYAFADQDDVWHPRKLISAINNLCHSGADLSVCNLMLADANMCLDRPLFSTEDIEKIKFIFNNFLISNLHGCTQVWTKRLHDIIQSYVPTITFSHDVWVNAIANLVSSTYVDSNCYINYRLHGNNTSGYARNFIQRIKKGIKVYILSKRPSRYDLCNYLIKGYGNIIDMNDSRYEMINIISKYKDNIMMKYRLLMSKYINDTDFQRRCLNWICILLNKY